MKTYQCAIRAQSVALDAYVNDYHIYSSYAASHGFSTNLRAWMGKYPLQNVLRIQASTSGESKQGTQASFSVSVTASDGSLEQTVVQMSYPEGIAQPDEAQLPFDTSGIRLTTGHSLSFVCADDTDVVEKPWETTTKTITDPGSIFRLYAEIQRLFVEGDLDGLMTISQSRISFGAKVNGQSRPSYEKAVLDDLRDTFASRPQWRTFENPDRELTVHEFLPNKVVRVLTLEGNPPLRTVPDENGMRFGYDVVLAITDNGLVWIM
jgi:hypothetical protein